MNGSTMFNYQRDALDFLIMLSLSVLVKFILYTIYELLMWNSDKACQKALLI